MQTFLPYEDFNASAKCLDSKRLGKQRLECLQLLRANLRISKGWANHPAAVMWRGHSYSLFWYTLAIVDEWGQRGFDNSAVSAALPAVYDSVRAAMEQQEPSWLGDAAFHSSHRSNLLRKNPEWYSQFGWTDNPEAPYVWPTP